MNLTSIIIIITFVAALLEKISSKPQNERSGIWAKIKFENVALLLLGIALLFQLYEVSKTEDKEQKQSKKQDIAFENISNTQNKVNEANMLIDSVLANLKTEITYTKKEFEAIKTLNKEMSSIRKKINENIKEFSTLNENYSTQIKIERDKIKNDKPEVKVEMAKLLKDTAQITFQFRLVNFGKRKADKVEYSAIMVMTDSTRKVFKRISKLKTNSKDSNELSITSNNKRQHILNSFLMNTEEIEEFGNGFLLVHYKYFDSMTGTLIEEPLSVYHCTSFEEYNTQFGQNVSETVVNSIEKYLRIKEPKTHSIFFKNK